MAHEQNTIAILQFLIENLADLQDQQKEKQTAGKYSDLELAINFMMEDISLAQTSPSLRDRILALSTSSAAVMDETIAQQNHQYALALSTGDPTPHDTLDPETTTLTRGSNSIRLIDRSRPSTGAGSSRSSPASQTSSIPKECASCLEKFETTIFEGTCGHGFCLVCIKQMFLVATTDEDSYPPRCCGEVIPFGVAVKALHYKQLQTFCSRAMEWTAKDRLYCADPACSKFIPVSAIKEEIGTCRACGQKTHSTCRSLEHPNVDCPMDEALNGVLKLAEDKNWKRCFSCRNMVELRYGCHHITCRYVESVPVITW
ncbi:hypothetical protein N7492_004054 [Penicillium capsulatum]|uniref:RING-type domain-containing protein n=1 Tax=Penicillium capsulatum TaxID=69766 RepID=A0A9W9IMZ9_9EURO|nr:hypothetical protein N7492_004054 [Penicillium capsulatum]KAJ6121372.1 hypothetical protein N7512_003837 [Penicillium capsulatum]